MGNTKGNNYLKDNPTESFRMRFSIKYAAQLVELLNEECNEEERSFPATIERILVRHFKLNKTTKKKGNYIQKDTKKILNSFCSDITAAFRRLFTKKKISNSLMINTRNLMLSDGLPSSKLEVLIRHLDEFNHGKVPLF